MTSCRMTNQECKVLEGQNIEGQPDVRHPDFGWRKNPEPDGQGEGNVIENLM
jgi:hypothetical protein